MVNTKQVRDRRKLRFENVDAAIANAEVLADADRRGALRATGNWTLGQAFGHVAFWANAPYDGYPQMPMPPWWMRMMMPLMRSYLLNKGMPAGIRLRGVAEGTFGTELMSTDEGLAALRTALARLAALVPADDNPAFGRMTHEDWLKLNLRHAELHLSFLRPGGFPTCSAAPCGVSIKDTAWATVQACRDNGERQRTKRARLRDTE